MTRKQIDEAAKKIAEMCSTNNNATVAEIAEAVGLDEPVVTEILDSYHVDDKGKVSHAGEGKGGGWVPQPEDN